MAFESAGFQLFPQILLFIRELARQSFDGNAVLRAEVAPKDETQIELSGFIGDRVVDFRIFLSSHGCTLTQVGMAKSLSAFPKIVHRAVQTHNQQWKGRTLKVRPLNPHSGVANRSGDSDVLAEINVLNRIQQFDALIHRALKCFASGDKSGAAAAFVDNGGADRFGQISRAF